MEDGDYSGRYRVEVAERLGMERDEGWKLGRYMMWGEIDGGCREMEREAGDGSWREIWRMDGK